MSERRITISPKVDRSIYFRFKDLCHAHGIAAERGVEQAMKDVLDRAGVAEDGERMENAPLAHKKGSSGIPGSWRLACSATSARWVVV